MSERGGLYVVTGHEFSCNRTYPEVVDACIKGGANIIQLREKDWSASLLFKTGLIIRELTRKAGVQFIVNDRIDLALAVKADGVHIGQQDLPLIEVKKLVGSKMIVGVSVNTASEAIEAEKNGASYLGISPVFPTETKKDAGQPSGIEMLLKIRSVTNLPIFAIGGIKLHNVASVIKAGADGAAVISAIISADNITEAAKAFVKEIQKAKHGGCS
jgi:thiamine-phosphate pyrophosphorylase